MWIDSHAHLEMKEFDPDRPQVIERAVAKGITGIITIGTDLESSQKSLALAKTYQTIWATVGVHPHDAASFHPETLPQLTRLAQDKQVVALGEIGLDFYRNLSPQKAQIETFRQLIQLAKTVNLPIIIHDREAHEEVLAILREEKAWEVGGVFHCFSGDWEMAKQCLDLNFFLSVTGAVTYKKGSVLEEVVRRVPIESLLLETDAPFLSPHPFRGKRNEPAYLVHTAEHVARLRGLALSELSQAVLQNTSRVFKRLLEN
ncbi:MAG: hydrolase TatD [Deltaproteobacteria bacterium RBG_13_43_22]|nr:MAG: hydrolase TatD [Deltaproteobacteria bacterium RBG_13_43_22]